MSKIVFPCVKPNVATALGGFDFGRLTMQQA